MNNLIFMLKPALPVVVLGTGVALVGCLDEGSTSSAGPVPSTHSADTGSEYHDQANSTLVFRANLAGSSGAEAAYIEQLSSIDVRVFHSPFGSWDELWEYAGDGYDVDDLESDDVLDFFVDVEYDDVEYDFEWDSGYIDRLELDSVNNEARVAVSPGKYMLVARGWQSDQDASVDPPWAQSASLVDLSAGEHRVVLNLLSATWEIEGGPLQLQALTEDFDFDWNPEESGTQSPADVLGLNGGNIHGVHVLPYIGDAGDPDLLGYLAQTVLYRQSAADGQDGFLEPDRGDIDFWEENGDSSLYIWWDIEVDGALGQDYSDGLNRARLFFPEVYIEAVKWEEDDDVHHEGESYREAALHALGQPLFAPDLVIDGDEPGVMQYRDYRTAFFGEVCIVEPDDDAEKCQETRVVSVWGGEGLFEFPDDLDLSTYPLGEVVDGNTITATLIEYVDRDWIDEQMIVTDPPQFDAPLSDFDDQGDAYSAISSGAAPVAVSQGLAGVSVTGRQGAATRERVRLPKRQAMSQALAARVLNDQAAAAAVSGSDTDSATEVSGVVQAAAQARCFDADWQWSDYYSLFVWDPGHNAEGGWRSGSWSWDTDERTFEVGRYWGLEDDMSETFYSWHEEGQARICLHPVTLKASDISDEVRGIWQGVWDDVHGSDDLDVEVQAD
ncbi:hypothetical protein [Halorhodospira halochloris]|uniref:hypothetical protein n=1 Tax=Halorhodospira halochloris TaxID=1052 RepID=UPI001EE9A107|nr:hypothetical protein [Halorhodospira halochloris]MCG5547590.1 hypothetical protein [Halorhodospira halochloris]